MVVDLEKLLEVLQPIANRKDTLPSEALWIKLAPYPIGRTKHEKTVTTVEYRSPDGNTLVNIDVDRSGAILGIEIFP